MPLPIAVTFVDGAGRGIIVVVGPAEVLGTNLYNLTTSLR
jgi:hypothetical protein